MPFHSIVIPVFNEADGIPVLFERLKKVMDGLPDDCEAILVNDGSRDGSGEKLDQLHELDSRFKVLHLSRNFGHQISITAGIEWARGDTVTVMDADLQDPPELIHQFLEKWQQGFDVVYAVRRTRRGEHVFKRLSARLFYRLIRKLTQLDLPVDTGDFRLMDRKVVDAYLSMPERNRYVRGLISWVGFKQTGIPFDRAERAHGETHYPLRKMIRLAFDGITSFSNFPLRMATNFGFFAAAASFVGGLYALYQRYVAHETVPGWTSLMVVVFFLGGIQLVSLGILGEYVGRIFDETRGRPLYFVGRTQGLERQNVLPMKSTSSQATRNRPS